ncbi:MAG: 50S ribosomal protein L15 [Sandaracinaceae bacterium]|nr:50S ribosomal protein L15 [Sandaracinaceae bacterium]
MADSDKEVPVLSRLRPPAGAVKKRTRFGRGIGSGLGKTAGRGQKGQKARQPGNIHKRHFEGGQIPLQRRLPKFGFNNIFSVVVAEVNVRDLNRFDAGATVDADALRAEGLIKGRFDVLKVLGHGEIDRKLTVKAHKFSASARAKIEAAGGAVEEIAIEA